jgi:hypothetical protein
MRVRLKIKQNKSMKGGQMLRRILDFLDNNAPLLTCSIAGALLGAGIPLAVNGSEWGWILIAWAICILVGTTFALLTRMRS